MRSPESEALALLGLARRAGGVAMGSSAAAAALRRGEAFFLLVAGDASPTQLRKLGRAARGDGPRRAVLADRAALGAALGRASLSVVAVTDASIASRIAGILPDGEYAGRAPDAPSIRR